MQLSTILLVLAAAAAALAAPVRPRFWCSEVP
jgi:hypothetical protein